MNNLTEQKKRILKNFHLLGYMGNCGQMTKNKRLSILLDLVADGYLTPSCKVTKKGIDATLLTNN